MRYCQQVNAETGYLRRWKGCSERTLLGASFPLTARASQAYAVIAAARRAAGRPINHADCQIAAIARCRGASVATRDVDDFEGSGIEVINPWANG